MRGREISLSRTGFPKIRGARFFVYWREVERLHAAQWCRGVWDVTGITGDQSWNVYSKGRVR